jgi:hypothetical protein
VIQKYLLLLNLQHGYSAIFSVEVVWKLTSIPALKDENVSTAAVFIECPMLAGYGKSGRNEWL